MDHIFFTIDKILHRSIAGWPYQQAHESLLTSALGLRGIEVWTRNSFKRGNFVFGISDLDITVLVTPLATASDLKKILRTLVEHKRLYPFLGEANFIKSDTIAFFESSLNFYERRRDPELEKYLQSKDSKDLDLEKAAFLLRMLYSDRVKLARYPYLRQKKWQFHFKDLELGLHHNIKYYDVIEAISSLLKISVVDLEFGLGPLSKPDLNDEFIFHNDMPEIWKYLYPNKHLWFHNDRNENIEKVVSTPLGNICLKQIEWEMWGLMTQYPYLNSSGLKQHTDRLAKVANLLSSDSRIAAQSRVLVDLVSNSQNLINSAYSGK